jgi:hypothetical protein
MPIDRSFIEQNRTVLEKLQKLIASLSDQDLAHSLGDGWTVAVALAHIAFWDQRALVLLERWEHEGGVTPSSADAEAINEAALPAWLAIPPREAAKLALMSAPIVAGKLENVAPEILEQNEALNAGVRILRAAHWTAHIEQIERTLKR